MVFEIEEPGRLECLGNGDGNGMSVSWSPVEKGTEVDDLDYYYYLGIYRNDR